MGRSPSKAPSTLIGYGLMFVLGRRNWCDDPTEAARMIMDALRPDLALRIESRHVGDDRSFSSLQEC